MITANRSGTPDSPANDGTSTKTLSSAIENSSVGNDSSMSIVRDDQRVAPAAGVAADEPGRMPSTSDERGGERPR